MELAVAYCTRRDQDPMYRNSVLNESQFNDSIPFVLF